MPQFQLTKGSEQGVGKGAKEEFAYCGAVCSVAGRKGASRLPGSSSLIHCLFPSFPLSDGPGGRLLTLLRSLRQQDL